MADQWEYSILTALEAEGQVQFTISYAQRVESPHVDGRLTILTEMGRNGWELVAVNLLEQNLQEFYFKRRIEISQPVGPNK